MSKDIPLIEPVYCPDIFANGIAKVESVGGQWVRVWFYADTIDNGQPTRVIVAKMIRPLCSLIGQTAIMQMVEQVNDLALH